MQLISNFIEQYSSTFEQCLLAKDPIQYVKSLPDSIQKKLIMFLFEPHSSTYKQQLKTKYNIKGQLLQSIDKWKIHSKITKAKDTEQIKYLIKDYIKNNKNNFDYPKPAQFQTGNQQNKNQQYTLPSKLKPLKSLQQWVKQQLLKNEDIIQQLTKKEIRTISQKQLLALKKSNKQKILSHPQLLTQYTDKFVMEFIKSYYQQMLKTNKNYELSNQYYKNLSINQFNILKDLIPQIINKREYLNLWFSNNYSEKLLKFNKSNLTITQKDQKRLLLKQILQDLTQFKTTKVKPIQRRILRQILQLDISRNQVDKNLFIKYLKDNPQPSSYESQKFKNQKFKKSKQKDQSIPDQQVDIDFNNQQMILNQDSLIKQTLQRIFKNSNANADDLIKQFQQYFQIAKLNKIYAIVKLTEGGSINQYEKYLSATEIKQLKQQKQITILNQNKSKWKAGQQIQLKIRVKNIKNINVKIYKIDLQKHYLQNNTSIDYQQNLLYLHPNHSYIYGIDKNNQYLIQIFDIKIEGIPKSRGSWIIELQGQGISSRAFINKGSIVNMQENNTAGTQLKFYDQDGNKISDYNVWMDGKNHSVKQKFTIPYGQEDKDLKIIFVKDEYASIFEVFVPKQKYLFNVSYIYNTESFIVGSIAKVLLHPELTHYTDRNIRINLKLLEKVKILVTLTNNLDIKSTIQIDNVQFKSNQDYLLQFPIQSYIKYVNIQVSAKIKKYNKKYEDLSSSHSIDIKLNEHSRNFIDIYLRTNKKQYCAYVLGKNGEPIPKTEIIIRYKVDGRHKQDTQNLMTTKQGCVFLGNLDNILYVNAAVRLKEGIISRSWNLQKFNKQVHLNQSGIYKEKEDIVFPIIKKQKINLWKITTNQVLAQNLSNKIQFDQYKIIIPGLQAGEYRLNFVQSQKSINFTVVKGKTWVDDNKKIYNQLTSQICEINRQQNNNLILGDAKFTKQGQNVKIQIPVNSTYDFSKDSSFRAHLIASNFMIPKFEQQFNVANLRYNKEPKITNFNVKQSLYFNNKKLPEEQSYVINRNKQKKYIGNNLQKPKIFLKRIQVKDTTQLQQKLDVGGNYSKQNRDRRLLSQERCMRYSSDRRAGESSSTINPEEINSHNNFLSLPMTILANQKGNTLTFVVPNGYSHYQCYLFTKWSAISKSFQLQMEQIRRKNLSHSGIENNSSKNTAWTMSRQVYKARKGQKIKVGRDSVWAAVGLSNIASFAKTKGVKLENWVTDWNSYSEQQKLSTYDQNVCHQLNTYIKFNDPKFFTNTVFPFIKNKLTKTFVDLCLLDSKQALTFINIDKFSSLNEFQKVLLVDQLIKANKKQQAKWIVNSMENVNKSQRITFDKYRQQFDTVITAKLTQQAQKDKGQSQSAWGQFLRRKKVKKNQQQNLPIKPMEQMHLQLQQHANYLDANQQCDQYQCAEMDAYQGDYDDQDQQEQQVRCMDKRKQLVVPFKQIQKTKQYTQTTYSNIKYPKQSQKLVKPSPFWTSAAQYFLQKQKDFLSQNFMYLTTSIEFTLASCFIPAHKLLQYGLSNQNDHVLISPNSSFLIFVKQVKQVSYQKKFGVLLNQRFFNPDDRYYYQQDGTKIQKQTQQFVIRRPYCIQTLITNTSGTRLQLQLLIDLPQGSIPLESHELTQIKTIDLQPYSTLSFQRYFYFSNIGAYSLYPANACRNGLVIAKADQIQKINVLEVQTIKKMDTLQNVLKSGQKSSILQYLQTKNIFDSKIFDPVGILWMFKDKQFYLKVIDILRKRKLYFNQIWLFGYYHNDLQTITQFKNTSQIQNSENILSNISIFQYFPYYSSRAHKFLNQNKSTIRNDQFKKTYYRFLFTSLFNQPTSSRSRVAFIYYLLLQDRIEQASKLLSEISQKNRNEHQLQCDYIQCFIDMYQGYPSFAKSRKIAHKYADYPVRSWQKLFKQIINTLKQYDSQQMVQQNKITQFTATVLNEGNQLRINVPALTKVQIYFYDINLQLYFSMFPFTDIKTFSANTVPNSISVFEAGQSRQEKLLRKIQIKDCFVEVYSSMSGLRKKKIGSFLWSNPNISIKIKQENGYAQVFYQNKKQAGCYCKVYQMKNEESKFYRDGYTDITGTFKYAISDLEGVTQFSILFITENGGVLERVKPPSQQGFLA